MSMENNLQMQKKKKKKKFKVIQMICEKVCNLLFLQPFDAEMCDLCPYLPSSSYLSFISWIYECLCLFYIFQLRACRINYFIYSILVYFNRLFFEMLSQNIRYFLHKRRA